MDVSLLYFDGCPNHHAALALLETLLAEAGWSGTIQFVNVDSPERAEDLNFRGSPTVLINGDDPFLDTEAPVGLSCRIYPTDEGYRAHHRNGNSGLRSHAASAPDRPPPISKHLYMPRASAHRSPDGCV